MPSSIVEGNSLLAIDVGAATTRAVFFDVIEGEYRFVATGSAPTTAESPFKDVGVGAHNAVLNLQNILGRTLLDNSVGLIKPSQPNGAGVDALAVTISAGPAVKTVVVGLLNDVSLDTARRLTESTYSRIVETIGLGDLRKPDQQIDSILRLRPDLVVITGGTDGGASKSIQKLLEPIGLASFLLPEEKRPAVLFAGNQKMEEEVKGLVGSLASSLHFSPNVRPSLDTEDIDPAERELARMFVNIRKRQIRGVDMLDAWSGGHILPTAYATGRMVRFLSKVYGSQKGILSVDIGSSAAIISGGFNGKSTLSVYPQFGLGENLLHLTKYTSLEDILRWCSIEVSPDTLREFLYQKSLYPATIPATKDDFAISQAVSRQALYLAMHSARRSFPKTAAAIKPTLTPLFEPILAGGSALSDSSNPGHSLLLLLDSLQPVGVTTVILDQNNLLALLGSAASQNNVLPVQVLESGAFLSMGTVVSPVVSENYGTPILRGKLVYENGAEAHVELKYGTIETLPLNSGETGKLTIKGMRGADIGLGSGKGGTITVSGGAMGVVFDGRGRPIDLPKDHGRRRGLIKKWTWALGGE